ncbi:substrate-binding domain-containing protein, partial [Streptomyces sp. MS191]
MTPDLQNAVFPAITEAVGSELTRRGFTPVLCAQSRGGGSEPAFVEFLLRQRFSGIVFAGGHYAFTDAPHGHYRRLARRSLPVALFNAGVPGLPFPRVVCSDETATELGWRHLASLGHERIGLILGPRSHLPSERKAVRARALGADPSLVVRTSFSLEAGRAVAGTLLRAGVTAVLCASDPLALGVIRAVRRSGLHVPHDVSVVGYDDSPLHDVHEPAADDDPAAGRGDGARGRGPALRADGHAVGVRGRDRDRPRADRPRVHRPPPGPGRLTPRGGPASRPARHAEALPAPPAGRRGQGGRGAG